MDDPLDPSDHFEVETECPTESAAKGESILPPLDNVDPEFVKTVKYLWALRKHRNKSEKADATYQMVKEIVRDREYRTEAGSFDEGDEGLALLGIPSTLPNTETSDGSSNSSPDRQRRRDQFSDAIEEMSRRLQEIETKFVPLDQEVKATVKRLEFIDDENKNIDETVEMLKADLRLLQKVNGSPTPEIVTLTKRISSVIEEQKEIKSHQSILDTQYKDLRELIDEEKQTNVQNQVVFAQQLQDLTSRLEEQHQQTEEKFSRFESRLAEMTNFDGHSRSDRPTAVAIPTVRPASVESPPLKIEDGVPLGFLGKWKIIAKFISDKSEDFSRELQSVIISKAGPSQLLLEWVGQRGIVWNLNAKPMRVGNFNYQWNVISPTCIHVFRNEQLHRVCRIVGENFQMSSPTTATEWHYSRIVETRM